MTTQGIVRMNKSYDEIMKTEVAIATVMQGMRWISARLPDYDIEESHDIKDREMLVTLIIKFNKDKEQKRLEKQKELLDMR